ncbi:spermatogenesis associated 6-like protein isoform X9 [Panthera leo]|uniref:spermatogenesis associated 6-like protein isoform X9 n=1 Tax=Panthera leo TaxID=9689 RepID=UPI001C695D1A|nr:spermatogenesis associated 6-like protein isoform X9 [Panthera leo]
MPRWTSAGRDSCDLDILFPIGDALGQITSIWGIAPKIEFSTRTAIRERVFLHRNRFLEEREKSRRPLSTSDGPRSPLNNVRMRPKDSKVESTQSWAPSPCSPRCFVQDQPTPPSLGNNFRISGESKPPFVVRHVDSAKPFGDSISELQPRKSRTKPKFSNLPFPGRRASSFDSFAANIKVIKEPDERIVLRKESPSPLDSSKFGKPSPSYGNQGDADFHREASFATDQPSRSSSPLLDQPLLRERFHLYSQSTWRKIHERVCGLLTSHRAQQHLNKVCFCYRNILSLKQSISLKDQVTPSAGTEILLSSCLRTTCRARRCRLHSGNWRSIAKNSLIESTDTSFEK